MVGAFRHTRKRFWTAAVFCRFLFGRRHKLIGWSDTIPLPRAATESARGLAHSKGFARPHSLLRRDGRERALGSVADNHRGHENDQLLFLIGAECSGEKFAQPRYVSQEGNLFVVLDLL